MVTDTIKTDRPVVLVTVPNYLPGYKAGGALRTVAAMALELGEEFQFKVVTSDRDVGDATPYRGIRRDVWVRRDEADVQYLSPGSQTFLGLRRVLSSESPDLLYLNGLYHPVFVFRVLVLRRLRLIPECPVLVAARGHLSSGAMMVKAFRKRLYINLVNKLGLIDGVVFQATDESERREILESIPDAEIQVAPNVTASLQDDAGEVIPGEGVSKYPGRLRVLYLSRIAPEKNLMGVLRTCDSLSGEITLSIVGPVGSENYWSRCREMMRNLPGHIQATYEGPVPHKHVPRVLRRHHLLFLPTRSENFGHVIQEALQMGRPVLISDRTPWNGVHGAGAGWVCPLGDVKCFRRCLERCVEMDQPSFEAHCRAAREYVRRASNQNDAIARNRSLLLELTS